MSCCDDVLDPPDVGTTVRLDQAFTELSFPYDLYDPETVLLKVKDPEGTETFITPVHDSLGHYHGDVEVGVAGQWRYRWETGTTARAFEGSFVVRRSEYDNYDPPNPQVQLTWAQFDVLAYDSWDRLTWEKV